MDGSRTTHGFLPAFTACAQPAARGRLSGASRRREQLRLMLDQSTRTAAAQVMAIEDREAHAFDALYLRYAPYAAAIGARLLGRDDELDDLVQDVFMQVLRGLGQLREPAAFKAWFLQITIRGATRRLRKRCLRRDFPQELSRTQSVTPEQRMLSREIYSQLDVLAPKSRVIWVLRHVEGEPLHVIAERIGCSLLTVQRHLIEAQSTLEDRFLQDYAV